MQKCNRRIFILFCLVVYALSTFGITINKHFCGGELESVTLLKKSNCCTEDGDDEPMGCCEDETIYLANHAETVNTIFKPAVDPVFIHLMDLVGGEFSDNFSFPESDTYFSIRGKPPRRQSTQLSFIMVFRI